MNLIDPEKTKQIIEILQDHGSPELTKEFRAIVAMARSRQEARSEIKAQSLPIFLHLIPYAVLTIKGIEPPSSWKWELRSFFGSIDTSNLGKNKVWFSDKQVLAMLNDRLNIQVNRQILNKIESFKQKPYYSKLVQGVNDFFIENKKLEDLGIDLIYVKEGRFINLSLSIRGKKIF